MINIINICGIKVIINEVENDKKFSLSFCFNTGSKHENYNEKGISHLLEHMMFTGTPKRNSFQISEEMDFYGATMNAYTTKNITNYYFSSLSKYQKETLDIFFDMISNPIFLEEQLKKEKEIVCEEIIMDKDDIKVEVYERTYFELIDGNLRYNILGSEKDVKNITRDMLIDYYKKRYTKDNMMILISGNIDKNILEEMIKKYFLNFQEKCEIRKFENKLLEKKVSIKKEINQVNIHIFSEIKIMDIKNNIILLIINSILGDGFSSRLFNEIREKEALAYSVYSYFEFNNDLNFHSIYIGTSKTKYEKALEITESVIKKLREFGISKREFLKAKNTLLSNIAENSTNYKKLSSLLNMIVSYDKVYEKNEIEEIIENIKIDEVNENLKNIFTKYSLAIIGDIND